MAQKPREDSFQKQGASVKAHKEAKQTHAKCQLSHSSVVVISKSHVTGS